MEITGRLKSLYHHPWFAYGALYTAWLALFSLWFVRAWVSEDAYITFRVIDNALGGYGLRWNIYERVQAYTHPLWMLLNLGLASLWTNLFHANIALSLVCSAAAVAIVLLTFYRRPLPLLMSFFLLPLFVSKCFSDYTTSGLETSLSFLLFALIGYVIAHGRHHRFFWLAFAGLCSLLLLNRLDHVVLIAPLCLWLVLEERPNYWHIAIAALPLAAWHLFALFYYGFPFPNTKYAKLHTGFDLWDYLNQGSHYAFIWLTQDTASILVLLASLVVTAKRWKKLPFPYICIAAGIMLNIAYVIYIGGDYMMGRFWAFPFFVSSWLLIATLPDSMRLDYWIVGILALAVAAAVPYFVEAIRTPCPTCIPVKGRVIDAQRIFWRNHLFEQLSPPKIRMEGQYKFGRQGKELAAKGKPVFKTQRFVGMLPYYVGPSGVFIDELALADALLARLPAQTNKTFYIGHFRRDIPKGYEKAVRYGDLSSMQPDLAAYYEKLQLITQGELWNKERLATIIRFNLGQYDYYRKRYIAKKD